MQRTNFKPKWCGANSTALTVPFASDNTALSTQREFPELDCCCCCCCCVCCWEEPFGWFEGIDDEEAWEASDCPLEICSQILTVRSKDEEAMMDPNSGCAQAILDMAASWAYIYTYWRQVNYHLYIDWLSERGMTRPSSLLRRAKSCYHLLARFLSCFCKPKKKGGWTRKPLHKL